MADDEKLQIQEISKQLTKISRSLSFHSIGPKCCKVELPSRDCCLNMMQLLRSVLFPGFFQLSEFSEEAKVFHIGAILDRVAIDLREQVRIGGKIHHHGEDLGRRRTGHEGAVAHWFQAGFH